MRRGCRAGCSAASGKSLLRQRDTDDIFVVTGKHTLVGKGGVGPDDGAARVGGGGFEELCAAEFFVAFRGESGDDEVALFIGEEEAVGVFNQEGIRPADGFVTRGGGEGFPETLAGVELQAAEFAIAAHAVDVTVLDKGRAHEAVQCVGLLFAKAFAFPLQRGSRLCGFEFEALRTSVKGAEQK